jgi:thiol:disulfide interchange protein DsbD
MLKAILLLSLSLSIVHAAEEHATVSVQRHNGKMAVTINHDKGWHTYWKNPGDAGLPTGFKFTHTGKTFEPKAFEWPVPTKHIEAGDILTIGYEGVQHFFFDDVKNAFELHVTMLICKDICIPGEAKLMVAPGMKFVSSRSAQEYSSSELDEAFEKLPAEVALPQGLEYYLTRVKDQNLLTLHYSLKGLKDKKLPQQLNFLTAFPHPPFGFKRETLYFEGDTLYGKTEIEWDGEYQEPAVPLPGNGQFKNNYGLDFLLNAPGMSKVNKVKLKIKDFTNSTTTLDEFYKKLPPFDSQQGTSVKGSVTDSGSEGNFLKYLLLAFLGGLILNLMPCVLPVISLKLFGLIKHQNASRKRLLAHNGAYTAGVLSTFMVLGIVVAVLKSSGEQIGWGFQLQSPGFILIMMLILFVMALNMFGLFEFYTPGGAKLGSAQLNEGLAGDFFSGVLTTILSTPCSAPFLGTALTFAFTTSNTTIFVMFFMIGLGLAFPFLITAAIPQSLHFLPRPGAWMEKLKYFLGLTLLVTVIWLYDVFVSLVHFEVVSWRLNILFALWFFAFFFVRRISQHKITQFVVFSIPLVLTAFALQNLELRPLMPVALNQQQGMWIPWTEEKMVAEKEAPVFVDFTAQWCLTCKVNKKFVLETKGFDELRAKYHLKSMRADWTKRDDSITQFLMKHGAAGVPAYFLQKNGKLHSLGETVSLGEIEELLR